MLSILIPTFNYNVFPLAEEIHTQCNALKVDFEIIVFDDASQHFRKENGVINTLNNCSYTVLEKNIGRSAIRNVLAKKAHYNRLLFLDADVRIISKNFIANYLNHANASEVVFGGCDYRPDAYKPSKSLRYYYGKNRETVKAKERNAFPFKHILSANFFISKTDFLTLKIPDTNVYGMDLFFSYLLIKNNKSILHIDNPVWHCGLEDNDIFLEKSLKSVLFRKKNWRHIKEIAENNALIKTYNKVNFFPLNSVLKLSFYCFNSGLKKLFFKPKPCLWAFDLYRLLYLFK